MITRREVKTRFLASVRDYLIPMALALLVLWALRQTLFPGS